jgi:AcrR family transcriptional regulator
MKRARTRLRTDHRKLPRPGGRTARTTAAVLDAAFRLLTAKGVQNLTIAEVAEASGIHETTIYRRWKTVNALALDACLWGVSIAVPPPQQDSLQADLLALIRSIIRLFEQPAGKAMLDIMSHQRSAGRKSARRVFREALCRRRRPVRSRRRSRRLERQI